MTTWFGSNIILFKKDRSFLIPIAIAYGFMLYDEVNFRLFFRDFGKEKMDYQSSAHHYMGIIYFTAALVTGYGSVSCTSIGLICEISTIFLNIRSLLTNKKSIGYTIISVLFFISYTVLRVIFFPFLFSLMLAQVIAVWPRLSATRKVSASLYLTISLALMALMGFWYY